MHFKSAAHNITLAKSLALFFQMPMFDSPMKVGLSQAVTITLLVLIPMELSLDYVA